MDAIVNAANGHLAHGGGVAAAIARAAGSALEDECAQIIARQGPLATGEAVATTAGALPFKAVIHAVGPRQGEGGEHAKLVQALSSAFSIAAARGWCSIAFTAVSSGIFGVAPQVCFSAYLDAVHGFSAARPDAPLALFRLVLVEGPIANLAREHVARRG
ncbi:MAG: macro domain-containing protein [Betaproteobacteria bacterium]